MKGPARDYGLTLRQADQARSDFAAITDDLEGIMASVTGGVTPVYAAPETFDGWVSRFCDQYSLAIVYQELLSGQRPFNGTNVRQLIMQHLQAAPNLASLPLGDQSVVSRALSKNPDHRFPSCREFVQALRVAQGYNAVPTRSAEAPPPSEPAALSSGSSETGTKEEGDTGKISRCHAPAAPASGTDRVVSKDTNWIRIHPESRPREKAAPTAAATGPSGASRSR